MPPPDLAALSRVAAQDLLTALAPRGGKAGPTPDTVTLGFADLVARCVVFDAREQEGAWGAGLGVELTGPTLTRPIRDTTGARGLTAEQALHAGVQVWLQGLYPPLRDALSDEAVPYPLGIVTRNAETGEEQEWCVYQSPLHIGGEENTHEKLFEQLKDPPLFLRLAQNARLPRLEGSDLHWMKLDLIGEGPKTMRVEAVFDSQRWTGVEGMFQDIAWPGTGIQLVRQYWVLTAN